jgi:hypothetical protein
MRHFTFRLSTMLLAPNGFRGQSRKDLARYLTGGPISDGRMIGHQDGEGTFWARGHDKSAGNQREPYTLRGAEFTRRWAMHILPKGFIKSRCFGGFSCRHRGTYLGRWRTLLGAERTAPVPAEATTAEPAEESEPTRRCPRCQTPMTRISEGQRVARKRGQDRSLFGQAVAMSTDYCFLFRQNAPSRKCSP